MRLISLLFVFAMSFAVRAEDAKISSLINLYGVTFQYGVPPWVTSPENPLSEIKPYRDQKGNSFIFELIPADENFDSWKTIFAVSAVKNNRTVAASIWKDYTLETFKRVCKGYSEKTIVQTEEVALVQVICPEVMGAPMKGYEGGMGEVGLFAFMIHNNVLINHHIEWRGNAFDGADAGSWPVGQAELDKALATIRSARAFADDKVVAFD